MEKERFTLLKVSRPLTLINAEVLFSLRVKQKLPYSNFFLL